MSNYLYILWIPLLPLATFVLLGLFGRKYFTKTAGIIGTASLLTSTIDASIESHLMGFAAEQSRKENKVVAIKV